VQPTDFSADCPGRLVEIPGGTWAFVPRPAPSQLDLDPTALRALTAAERALGQLTGTLRAAGRHVNPHLISAPLLRREALSSSRIEGTLATPEDLVLLEVEAEEDPTRSSPASDTQEVLNYIRALNHGFARLPELPVSQRLIREMHEVLMSGVRGDAERPGEFRNVQNFIGSSRDIREARFVPPPVSELAQCLGELEAFIHAEDDTLPHLIRLALVHYQFETIHPFRDGNGRVGRLLIPLLLCTYERIDTPALYLSPHLERHRTEYTDLLLRVSQTGDYLGWVRFFLEAVAGSALESVTRAEALLALRERYHARLQSARSSALLLRMVDSLFERPSTSIGVAGEVMQVTPAAAAANLRKLVEAEILIEVTGRRRDQRFVAPEILRVAYGE
jgi:Fic family protein